MSIDMVEVARRVLSENGFVTAEPPVDGIPARDPLDGVQDLRHLPWSSIDNHDSRDLDQIEWGERLAGGAIRMLVGIADVDALVPAGSPIDAYAARNTSTLYTGVHIFPMLPRELSEDRTSLLEDRQRLATITEMVVRTDGTIDDSATRIYPARVRNHAKLVYERVGRWLEVGGLLDDDHHTDAIADQVAMHDEAARRLRRRRVEQGALDFETIEARAVAKDGKVVGLEVARKNRARELVEDLMIAANGATARYLEAMQRSSIRRVVTKPKRWDRIVELARSHGYELPTEPTSRALADFLATRRQQAPDTYPELSLSVVKLLGPGSYVLQRGGEPDVGHFGLAVDDYAHSTAPNRRYPDLITQRLLKAASRGEPAPYSDEQLVEIAAHCTERENAARKVERTMRKVVAAAFLSTRIGETFDAVITGVTPKGVFARLFYPPAEGRIVSHEEGLDVGDRVRVRLVDTEPTRGFIDFVALR